MFRSVTSNSCQHLYRSLIEISNVFNDLGKRLADLVNPSNVAVSQKFIDMYNPNSCQQPYSTQLVTYILTLSGEHVPQEDCDFDLKGQLVFVGFDTGI